MKDKFIKFYIDLAERTAQLSSAERLKVGAVLVKNNRPLVCCYNGTPTGYHSNVCEDENYVTKPVVLHAEENILASMARSTESSDGAELFMTHSPCAHCAPQIFQAGIKKVYYKTPFRYTEGIEVLHSLGITCEKVKENDND